MKQKGFTLIELLVVIAIIGLLVVIVMVNLSNVRARARDARRLLDAKQIALAMELYYNDEGEYLVITGLTPSFSFTDPIGDYLNPSPRDPLSPNREYKWIKNDNDCATFNLKEGQWYCIFVVLETAPSNKNLIIIRSKGSKIKITGSGPDMDNCQTCLY